MDVCFTSFGHEGYLNCNIDFLLSKEKGVRNKLAFFLYAFKYKNNM